MGRSLMRSPDTGYLTALSDFCTRAEKFDPEKSGKWSRAERDAFYFLMTDMRLNVWLLVAMLKKKLGSIVNPRNLPDEIWQIVSAHDF